MKVLHILKREPEKSTMAIIEEQSKYNEIKIICLYKDKDYDSIVELIEKSDKVISW